VAFDIEFVAPDVSFDFSGVTNTFWELRERGGLFNPRNLVQLVGRGLLPRVVENMLDAKVELDGRLRTVINDFTNTFAIKMTSHLSAKMNSRSLQESYAAVTLTCKAIEKEVPNLRRMLDDYLEDTRTKETLVGAVQDLVLQLYREFFNAYVSAAADKDRFVRKKGKSSEDSVWDTDTFTEWSEGIFRVGVGVLGLSEGEEDDGNPDYDDDEG
jgi:hypothetical protein